MALVRKIGWLVAVLNMAAMACSAFYFLLVAQFHFIAWFFFNICFSSTLVFLLGFFLKNRLLMTASIPFLAFFGGGGLLVFGWKGVMIPAQVGHVFMVLAILYTIAEDISARDWKRPVAGLLAGLSVFLFFLPVHQRYVRAHPEFRLNAEAQQVVSGGSGNPREETGARFDGEIPPGECVIFRYDGARQQVSLLSSPDAQVTAVAATGVALAPRWLRAQLRSKLSQLPGELQDALARLLLDCGDRRLLDEIAFSIANMPVEELQRNEFRPGLLRENAELVYAADALFDYVQLVDYGVAGKDDDFYTTARYRMKGVDGNDECYELPREMYYWYVVHPKLQLEPVICTDPTTGEFAEPDKGGVHWRRYFLSEAADPKRRASTHFMMEYPNLIGPDDVAACAPAAQGWLADMKTDPIPLIVDSETNRPVLCVFAWPGEEADGNVIATTIPVETAWEDGNAKLLENLLRAGNGSAMLDPKLVPDGLTEVRFAILKDRDPFGKPTIETALKSLGFSYDVFQSNRIDELLDTGNKYLKIIVPSGQPLALYRALAEKREAFKKWMTRETYACCSVIEFHGAVDLISPGDDWAGITMPWGFTCVPQAQHSLSKLRLSGYPTLQDVLRGAKYLWDGKPLTLGGDRALDPASCVYDRLGYFVTQNQPDRCSEVPQYYRGPDCEARFDGAAAEFVQKLRSHFPQRSLYLHYGNCGEVMDMLSAACRTALVPVRNVIANCVDHVWNDSFMLGKWHPYTVFRSDGGTRFADGAYSGKQFAVMGCRPDGCITNAISNYCKDTVTLIVNVKDKSGRPVDGATVAVKSHWNKGEPPPKIHAMVAWTDLNGTASVELGTERDFFIQVYSAVGCWPEGTPSIEEHRKLRQRAADDAQPPKLPEPALVIAAGEAQKAGTEFHREVVLPGAVAAPQVSEECGERRDEDAILRLSLNVTGHVLHGYCTYTQTNFTEGAEGGTVDVFLVDAGNLEKLGKHEPFTAAKVIRDASCGEFVLPVPDRERDWFVVLSNAHRVASDQLLRARLTVRGANSELVR